LHARNARWRVGQSRSASLVVAVVLLGWELYLVSDPLHGRPDDYVAFWASARVLQAGGDPYDPAALLAVQRTVHWTEPHAYRVWEPPWTFALCMPFALLPYRLGRTLWFVIHLLAIVAAADGAWRIYGGDPARRGLAWVVAFLFMPTVLVWRTGQLTGLVLLGLVWFLVCQRRRHDVAAGAALALAGMKPHIVHLVWPALLVWCATTRRWRILAGGFLVGAAATLFALSYRASLLSDFVAMTLHDPPRQGASTLGTVLRLVSHELVGEDAYGLVFVPPLAGLVWATRDARTRRLVVARRAAEARVGVARDGAFRLDLRRGHGRTPARQPGCPLERR
jgi:hypothetical protein